MVDELNGFENNDELNDFENNDGLSEDFGSFENENEYTYGKARELYGENEPISATEFIDTENIENGLSKKTEDKGFVLANVAYVFRDPEFNYKRVVAKLRKGSTFKLLKERTDKYGEKWYNIEFIVEGKKKRGWIVARLTRIGKEEEETGIKVPPPKEEKKKTTTIKKRKEEITSTQETPTIPIEEKRDTKKIFLYIAIGVGVVILLYFIFRKKRRKR